MTLRVNRMWGKPEGLPVNLRVYRLFYWNVYTLL